MGWSFTQDASRREVLDEITKGWEDASVKTVILARKLSGNTLWYVAERTTKPEGAVSRFIGCSLLQRMQNYGWGSKDMSEDMGPCEESCPLGFLNMVPDPGGYATEWRARVRAYHARVARKLAVGDEVTLTGGKVATITKVRPLRGIIDGTLYRIPRRMLAAPVAA